MTGSEYATTLTFGTGAQKAIGLARLIRPTALRANRTTLVLRPNPPSPSPNVGFTSSIVLRYFNGRENEQSYAQIVRNGCTMGYQMRKWLLASAIKVGWMAAAAAQTTPNDTPLLPRGMLGIPVQPSTYLGGHNMMNQDGAELPPSPIKPPPGTMVVHINGRMLTFFGVEGSSASDVGGNKLAPEQFTGQFRLYPGVDALATNGLRYGAIVENSTELHRPNLRSVDRAATWHYEWRRRRELLQQPIRLQFGQHAVHPPRGDLFRL